jgi:hypothetical protein
LKNDEPEQDPSNLAKRILVGAKCEDVQWPGPFPFFVFAGAVLNIQTSWRVTNRETFFGSGVEDPPSQDLGVLAGHSVVDAEVRGPFFDLLVVFQDSWTLETFADAPSEPWETWYIRLETGEMLIGGPGDDWTRIGLEGD